MLFAYLDDKNQKHPSVRARHFFSFVSDVEVVYS